MSNMSNTTETTKTILCNTTGFYMDTECLKTTNEHLCIECIKNWAKMKKAQVEYYNYIKSFVDQKPEDYNIEKLDIISRRAVTLTTAYHIMNTATNATMLTSELSEAIVFYNKMTGDSHDIIEINIHNTARVPFPQNELYKTDRYSSFKIESANKTKPASVLPKYETDFKQLKLEFPEYPRYFPNAFYLRVENTIIIGHSKWNTLVIENLKRYTSNIKHDMPREKASLKSCSKMPSEEEVAEYLNSYNKHKDSYNIYAEISPNSWNANSEFQPLIMAVFNCKIPDDWYIETLLFNPLNSEDRPYKINVPCIAPFTKNMAQSGFYFNCPVTEGHSEKSIFYDIYVMFSNKICAKLNRFTINWYKINPSSHVSPVFHTPEYKARFEKWAESNRTPGGFVNSLQGNIDFCIEDVTLFCRILTIGKEYPLMQKWQDACLSLVLNTDADKNKPAAAPIETKTTPLDLEIKAVENEINKIKEEDLKIKQSQRLNQQNMIKAEFKIDNIILDRIYKCATIKIDPYFVNPLPKATRAWSAEYAYLTDIFTIPQYLRTNMISRKVAIESLRNDFIKFCEIVFRIIVYECKTDKPQLKPNGAYGGVHGGYKYSYGGVLFKVAEDANKLFLDLPTPTQKSSANELRIANSLDKTGLSQLISNTLTAMIYHGGYAVIASAIIDINNKTLKFGSNNAATTIHRDLTDPSLTNKVEFVRDSYHLARHRVRGGPSKQYIIDCDFAVDVEIHKNNTGVYIIDSSRFLTPRKPRPSSVDVWFRRFRPEFMLEVPDGIKTSPDTFVAFGDLDSSKFEDQHVLIETSYAKNVIVKVAEQINNLDTSRMGSEELIDTISEIFHSNGANHHSIGKVNGIMKDGANSDVLISIAIARACKNLFRETLRRFPHGYTTEAAASILATLIFNIFSQFADTELNNKIITIITKRVTSYYGIASQNDVVIIINSSYKSKIIRMILYLTKAIYNNAPDLNIVDLLNKCNTPESLRSALSLNSIIDKIKYVKTFLEYVYESTKDPLQSWLDLLENCSNLKGTKLYTAIYRSIILIEMMGDRHHSYASHAGAVIISKADKYINVIVNAISKVPLITELLPAAIGFLEILSINADKLRAIYKEYDSEKYSKLSVSIKRGFDVIMGNEENMSCIDFWTCYINNDSVGLDQFVNKLLEVAKKILIIDNTEISYKSARYKLFITRIIINALFDEVIDNIPALTITKESYNKIITRWGSNSISSLINHLSKLIGTNTRRKLWYKPNASRNDAESDVKTNLVKFVIRYSSKDQKYIIITTKLNSEIQHFIIVSNDDKLHLKDGERSRFYYDDIINLIKNEFNITEF